MKNKKLTAALLIAAVLLMIFCSCGQSREGYMTNNCTKDGVEAFVNENPELSDKGFTKKKCYNITPDNFGGITMYKSSQTAYTVVQYPGYSYTFIDMSDAPGLINAYLCDFDGNNVSDILYTYSNKTTKEYGIGLYNGVLGYSTSVFSTTGEMCLYLVKQKAEEGMPDVFSVLAVTVEQFDNNPADLGCMAVAEVGVITERDGKPFLSADSGTTVTVVPFTETGVSKVIVSSVPSSAENEKTATDAAEIGRIVDFVKNMKTGEEKDPTTGTTYIIAFIYTDDTVAYAYYNDSGYFKLHGQNWRVVTENQILPF